MQKISIFKNVKQIPKSIWALGLVSLFTDIATGMIHSLLPIYIVVTLGASMTMFGIIEGVVEGSVLITKIISGVLSDYMKRRKILAVFGYSLAAVAKFIFPLAHGLGVVFGAHLLDRIGKGIRDAPRDALLSEIAPQKMRGVAFGLRQALDTVGAFVGPLLTSFLLYALYSNVRSVLWIAAIPALISVVILIFGVDETKTYAAPEKESKEVQVKHASRFSKTYWQIIFVAALLTLGRFSEAFLILKAKSTGVAIMYIPIVIVLMNLVYAATATFAGNLSDHHSRVKILAIGIAFLAISQVTLGYTDHKMGLIVGIIFWGLHLSFTEGVFQALIADTTMPHLRGTAYGMYSFVCGVMMIVSSTLAGILWDSQGLHVTFYTGAFFTSISCLSLFFLWHKKF